MTTMKFFDLPANILSNIYDMDTTFRDKFKDQINTQIWEKSYDMFRKKLIKQNVFNDSPIVARKLDILLQYLINDKKIMPDQIPDQIYIYTNWKNLNYENNTVSVEDTGYNNIDQGLFVDVSIDSHTDPINDDDIKIFRGNIYTTEQYNDMFGEINERDIIGCNLYGGCMVFKNNEFVIVKSRDYDDDYYDDGDYNEPDAEDVYNHNSWMYAPEDEY